MSLLERIKQANARQPAEEDVWVRASVLVAIVTAALAVVDQGVGGPVFRIVVVGGLPVAYWYSWRTRNRDGFWCKALVAVGAVLTLVWFVSTIAPRAGGTFADAQAPLAELLLMIQVLHGLDVPARRDLMFSLLSSAVLMAVAGSLSVSMGLLPYVVVWGVAAASALVLAHHSELAELPPLANPSGPDDHRRALRPVVKIVALSVAAGLGLFLVIPPGGTSRTLLFPSQIRKLLPIPSPGELSNSSLGAGDPANPGFGAEAKAGSRAGARASFGYFGFSTSLDLGARGRPDNTLVMRVKAAKPALWRGQTFDVWNGRTWTMSDQRTQTLYGPLPIVVPPPAEDGLGATATSQLVQTYYVVKPGPSLIFGAAPISKVYFPDRQIYELSDGTLRSGVELGKGTVYTVVSQPSTIGSAGLRQADSNHTPADITERYAQPPVITPRVRDLAVRATATATTTYDKVIDLEDAIAAQTTYTLNIPPLPAGADAVDQFLFVDHRGFCEQIATSLVVMLRSLGVPARVVAGYAPGLRNPFTGLFEVRASDAHLWTEVWFPGVGWQSFDPTAYVPLAGDQGAYRAGTGLGTYLSRELAGVPGWLEIGLLVVVAAALLTAGAVRLAGPWMARRRRPQPSWSDWCLARLEEAGEERGRPRRPSETVYEYASALEEISAPGGELDRVAALVSQAAFSGHAVDDDDRRWVEGALDEVISSRRQRSDPSSASRSDANVGAPGRGQ